MIGRDRDVMRQLLQAYRWIDCRIPPRNTKYNRLPVLEMLRRQRCVASAIRSFKPDVVASLMGSYTQTARLMGVPSVIFTDSEFQHFNHRIAHPFATAIHTPHCFNKNLGRKQIRYRGYHELAFLHPDHFQPRPEVLRMLDDCQPQSYALMRLSAWDTFHDIGHAGLQQNLDDWIQCITARLRLFIIAENGKLPAKWEPLRFRLPPDYFHDAIAYARLVVTEGASTASEAACLGVPAIHVNDTEPRGYLLDQEQRYGIVRNFRQAQPARKLLDDWLETPPFNTQQQAEVRQLIASGHIDVSRYAADVLLNACDAAAR